MNLRKPFVVGVAIMAIWALSVTGALAQVGQAPALPGNMIPQFVDPLPLLGAPSGQGGTIEVLVNNPASQYDITMHEFDAHILPTGLFAPGVKPATRVWGYRLGSAPALAETYIGPVIVADRSTATTKKPTKIKWVNSLPTSSTVSSLPFWKASVDQTLHWADPIGPVGNPLIDPYAGTVPAVVHLHGGEVPPQLDGGPDAWYTSDGSVQGHAYYTYGAPGGNAAIYNYPNTQEAAPIWFHDHALGITRLNVYAGLAGGYIIYDNVKPPPGDLAGLGGAAKIIPLVIQDRMFDINGQLFFPNLGINPEHPFWVPEFVGDVICVNGKSWPYLTVNNKRYRFLFLDGSNARFYDMFLIDPVSGVKGPPMYVISTDGGYLNNPVLIDPNATGAQTKAGIAKSLVIGPGERYGVIIDFGDANWMAQISAAYAAMGMAVPDPLRLHLRNTAKTPFPGGAPAPNSTTGRIMEFRVTQTSVTLPDIAYNPATTPNLRPSGVLVSLTAVTPEVTRQLTLNEVMGPGGPLEVLVNNTKWAGHSVATDKFSGGIRPDFTVGPDGMTYYSELPQEGQTELWEIINLTADAHPIHLHLVQFQLMNRQVFDVKGYNAAYNALFPGSSTIDPLTGAAFPPGVFIGGFGPPAHYNTGVPFNGTTTPVTTFKGGNPDVTPFLNAKKWPAVPPLANEKGWKDTVIMYPGQLTRIMVRWAPTDLPTSTQAANAYFPFDPNGGHGYVWHCHIIDHEDNEMMRPDAVQPNEGVTRTVDGPNGADY